MLLVGEIFSGDPYVPKTGVARQAGYRYFFIYLFQIDTTIGEGFAGEVKMPLWFSGRIRLVTEKFLEKNFDVNSYNCCKISFTL